MKLIIQIPCYNEEKTLAITVADLPRQIAGIDEIEYLIIDDGSTDATIAVAHSCGVHHIVQFPKNRGLAKAFMAGIHSCLSLGADIIVNTDGDNQYKGSDVERLVRPILEGDAEIVVGDRDTDTIEHFSGLKKKLQKFGSGIVRLASNSNVADTTSGFRAYCREAAMRLNVMNRYSYTLETIIDAGWDRLAIENVKIGTNGMLRKSRLFKSVQSYVARSAAVIIRSYTMRRPLQVFSFVGGSMTLAGILLGVRYLVFFLHGYGNGHLQSLILSAILLLAGIQIIMAGLLADAIAAVRKISDELLYRTKKLQYDPQSDNPPAIQDVQKANE